MKSILWEKIGSVISRILVPALFLAGTCAASSQTATNIAITNAVQETAVTRLGINLGDQTYWDSGQMMKNLVFQNPGFEGLKYRTILKCAGVTADTCRDDNQYSGEATNFWKGGTYLILSGKSAGESGTVVSSTKNPSTCSGCGQFVQFDQGVNAAVGDYFAVTNSFPGNGDAGWWNNISGGGTISTEMNDLSPNTPGKQALVLNASAAGTAVSTAQYFESFKNLSFIQMNGAFEVTFRAKGIGGANKLNVSVQRLQGSNAPYLNQTVALTNAWQDITLKFAANETGSAVGTVQLVFAVAGSSIELDDVSLNQTDSSAANTTVFRDDVVNALKELKPGTLRMMAAGAALGSDIPNQLAVPFARYREGFASKSSSVAVISYGIHEFLELCDTVGADPWITIPTATTPEEITDLIEYLTGDGSDAFSALRIQRGQSQPWTTVFKKVHLELGNETWNGDFKGESMAYPGYPQWANTVFGAARVAKGFQAAKFDLILDGWSAVPNYNIGVLATSTQHDSIDIAPYLLFSANNESQSLMFGALLAEPEVFSSPGGQVYQNMQVAASAPKPANVSVYETNLGTMVGNITEPQLEVLAPSLGAGLAHTEHMLQMMRIGVKYQNTFALQQYQFLRGDQSFVRLWGTVVDMGTTNRRRPQFLTQALANGAIGGNMMQTAHTGADPTWNQPLSSDKIQINGAHLLQSFAFLNGQTASAVVFNLSQTTALPVTFSGPNAPTGTVQVGQITSANITDNNEFADNVHATTKTLSGLTPATIVSLPPFSMTVLTWGISTTITQAPQFSVAAGTYSTSQTVSLTDATPGAVIHYTTDGSPATASSTTYTAAIVVSKSTTLNAVAIAPKFTISTENTAAYVIQSGAQAPVFATPTGTYTAPQSVAISTSTPASTIYYSVDGTVPTASSTAYSGPVTVNSSLTLKAIAMSAGYSNSAVSTAVYTLGGSTPAPVMSLAAGTYTKQQIVGISDKTAGAAIYYTTNGSAPTTASTLYAGSIKIDSTTTLKAIAVVKGSSSSTVTSATYTITSSRTATPILSVIGGTYNTPQSVVISVATPGAKIYYTTQGGTPTTSSLVYSGPIAISASTFVEANAIAPNMSISFTASASYNLKVATPTLSVAAGTYGSAQTVTVTNATPGASLFYTTNGTTPSAGSTPYTGPIQVSASQTVQVMGRKTGYANSAVGSAAYVISTKLTATPVLSVPAGTYASTQTVAITDPTPGAVIHYTINGVAPTATSPAYSAPITVASTQTIKAIATSTNLAASTQVSAAYTISTDASGSEAGFTPGQMMLRGSAALSGSTLVMTNGGSGQISAAWSAKKISVTAFTTDFSFQMPNSAADGFTFTLQNAPKGLSASGGNGAALGYAGITKSVALKFALYNPTTKTAVSQTGMLVGGANPPTQSIDMSASKLSLHSGHVLHAHIVYDGTTLTQTVTDTTTGASFTHQYAVDIATALGGSTAYVGFTASTGAYTSVQHILSWSFADGTETAKAN